MGPFMKLIDFNQKPVVGLEIDKKLEKDDITILENVVEQKLKVFPQLGIYIEMEDFKGITVGALIEDIRVFLPRINKFSKKALVCPESRLTNLGEKVASMIPGTKFKHFLPHEKEMAKAWVVDFGPLSPCPA